MIYLIGGAPRVGKTILGQQISRELRIGWVSTDLLLTLLAVTKVEGMKTEWNAAPEAITANATWFFPYLERFVWGVNSMVEDYVIEGVDFLPTQAAQLAAQYPIRAVFLGCSSKTPATLEQFPGRKSVRRRSVETQPMRSSLEICWPRIVLPARGAPPIR